MTINPRFVGLIGVFFNYIHVLRFVMSLVKRETGTRQKYIIITTEWIISQIPDQFSLFDCKGRKNDCGHNH